MSLLECAGKVGLQLGDALMQIGMVLGFVFLPLVPLYWAFFKVVDSPRLSKAGKVVGGVTLALIAITWLAFSMMMLKCMGY